MTPAQTVILTVIPVTALISYQLDHNSSYPKLECQAGRFCPGESSSGVMSRHQIHTGHNTTLDRHDHGRPLMGSPQQSKLVFTQPLQMPGSFHTSA
jgi:hypothetical protein